MRRGGFDSKQWKAITSNYDKIILDEPAAEKLYCFNDRQVEALLGITETLAWRTRWYSPTKQNIEAEQVREFRDEIRKILMGGCSCNCNGGSAWDDKRFRYELARLDDGTPRSYAPDAPRTTYNSDPDDTTPEQQAARYYALCKAVNNYVDTMIATIAGQVEAGAFVTGVIVAIVTALSPVLGVTIAITLSFALALLDALDNDAQAIEDVKCCMKDGLANKSPTFENFKHSLDLCNFVFGTPAAQLAGWLAEQNSFEANFRAFMVELGLQNGSAQSTDCEECGEWCYLFDLTVDRYENIVKIKDDETTAGWTWQAGVGYLTDNSFHAQITIYIDFPYGSKLRAGGWSGNGFQFAASVATYERDGTIHSGSQSGAGYFQHTGIADDTAKSRFVMVDGGITKCFVRGVGSPPFDLPSDCSNNPF